MATSVPPWLPDILKRVHALVVAGRVRFTRKALREVQALDVEIDETDARDVLVGLRREDGARRLRSRSTREWMYVFRPRVAEVPIYVKVILRADCVVVSFHEEVGDEEDEDDA